MGTYAVANVLGSIRVLLNHGKSCRIPCVLDPILLPYENRIYSLVVSSIHNGGSNYLCPSTKTISIAIPGKSKECKEGRIEGKRGTKQKIIIYECKTKLVY